MKHKILLLLFLFSLLPSWGWGQETSDFVEEEIDLGQNGYRISKSGTYIFRGAFKAGTIFDNGIKSAIVVNKGLHQVKIILEGAEFDFTHREIDYIGVCFLLARDADNVTLILRGKNVLKMNNCSGIWVPERSGCGIEIMEDKNISGSLDIEIINSASNDVIGNISAIGNYNGAFNNNIKISSGTINIKTDGCIGIGGDNCDIIINGGVITAISDGGVGIGGYDDMGSTFSTGDNGTAFINASSISDKSYKEVSNTKGLIFDGNDGVIYGDSYNLSANATIQSGKTLTITHDQTLHIAKDDTLTIEKGATLTNNGTIKCDGKVIGHVAPNPVQYLVTYNYNYEDGPSIEQNYIASGNPPLNDNIYNIKRKYYNFKGYFDKPEDDGAEVTEITEVTEVYAHWEPIEFTIKQPQIDITTLIGASFTKDITVNMFTDDILKAGDLKSLELKQDQILPKGLTFENSILSGTPTEVNESGTKITFVITANNDVSKEVSILLKVVKKTLTIILDPGQQIYEDETPTYKVSGVDNVDNIELTGSLEVANNKVTLGSLKLESPHDNDYSLLLDDNSIEVLSGYASRMLAILPPSSNNTYNGPITFTAPKGFEIALVGYATKADANLTYGESFVWDKVGTHEVTYSLKRTAGDKKVYQHSTTVTINRVSPPVDEPEDTTPVVYKVTLPLVEGILTDPVAGEFEVESWNSFTFTITIEEGYRMLSQPVVKVNDSEIAFSSHTDTTYTYKVKYIRTDKDISITGIVKDPATANNAIKASDESWKIAGGVAYITVAKPTVFAVVDMNGNIISTNYLAPGETPIYNLPKTKPLVFWFDGKRAGKVIIK